MRRVVPVLVLLLASCATVPRDGAPATGAKQAEHVPPPAVSPVAEEPAETPPAVSRGTPAPPPDLWARMRAGFAFADCERPRVVATQRPYLRSPERLSRALQRAAPLMGYVLDELDRRALPYEYALLPMVESGYVAVDACGNRPAGIWQIMPVTARGLGLAADARYDGRLDPVASTRAAATLLDTLADRFDRDWRLVTMAYNAGEYRVRRAVAGRASPPDHDALPLSPITHAHLAKLEGYACFVRDPARYGVALAPPSHDAILEPVVLEAATDLALAAALAREPWDAYRVRHPGHRDGIVAAGRSVLVPRRALARFTELVARIPPGRRTGWRRTTRAGIEAGQPIDAALLALVNADAGDGPWLAPVARPATRAPAASLAAADARHTVRSGESLWVIARRYRVSVGALLEWNGLDASALLKPGDVLRIAAPR